MPEGDHEASCPPTKYRRLEWAWFTLGVLALIAVVWYAFTAKGQLNEMINQNRLAQGLAKVSADQAVAVKQSADAAAEATRAARNAMAVVEQTSTKIAEENRAWVALKDSRLELRAGKRPTVSAGRRSVGAGDDAGGAGERSRCSAAARRSRVSAPCVGRNWSRCSSPLKMRAGSASSRRNG